MCAVCVLCGCVVLCVLWVVCVCGSGEPKEANESDAYEAAYHRLKDCAAKRANGCGCVLCAGAFHVVGVGGWVNQCEKR